MADRGTLARVVKAVRELNPGRTANESIRQFTLALVGSSEDEIASMRSFLLGPNPSPRDTAYSGRLIREYIQPLDDAQVREALKSDIVLIAEGAGAGFGYGENIFTFDSITPENTVSAIAGSEWGSENGLSLGRAFPAFRQEVARRIQRDVSKENATFVIATALGTLVPTPLQPLIGAAGAASDTIVLTANQVRMLFMIGAIYGENVGYATQWKEISSIVGAAFGWRALARSLVGMIPFGAGLAPKGAVAYAGTMAVGEGMIFYYMTGRQMTREEVTQAFKKFYSDAGETVRSLVDRFRSGTSGVGGNKGLGSG